MDSPGVSYSGSAEEDGALTALREAVLARDGTRLQDWVSDYASFCFKQRFPEDSGTFPPSIFEDVLNLLNDQQFLDLEGSWHLLMIFEYDWALLTSEERERLLVGLEGSYPKFADWMSRFVITELLGEHFADEKAFESLERLMTLPDDSARGLIAHGLEHLVRDSADPALSKRAIEKLQQMREDLSGDVRDNAYDTLCRLGIKTGREGRE